MEDKKEELISFAKSIVKKKNDKTETKEYRITAIIRLDSERCLLRDEVTIKTAVAEAVEDCLKNLEAYGDGMRAVCITKTVRHRSTMQPSRSKLSPTEIQMARKLRDKGMSYGEIADHFFVHKFKIWNSLNDEKGESNGMEGS